MIFVTTGTQFPFDRLVKTIDEWSVGQPDIRIFAQTGPEGVKPVNFPSKELLVPEEYEATMAETTCLVAHAGIGSIITALEYNIPAILMPRRFSLNEHRNDHQMATAEKFKGRRGIYIAMSESDLIEFLDNYQQLEKPNPDGAVASPELITFVSQFIAQA